MIAMNKCKLHIGMNCTSCLYLMSSELSNCFFAGPNSIPFTLLAKLSEQRVSLKSFSLGLICTNMSVLESPPNKEKLAHHQLFLSPYKL